MVGKEWRPMMPGTAQETGTPAGCGALRRRMDDQLTQFAGLMADVAADRDRPGLARRMGRLTAAFQETRTALAGHAFADALTAETAARPETGRHRAPARAGKVVRLRPRPAHGIAPAAILAALAGHGARKAVTAHLKLGLTAAAAAGVTAYGITYTIARTPDQYPYTPAPARVAPAAADNDDAAPPAAVTIRYPEPKGKHHRPTRQQPVLVLPSPSPPPSPPSSPPPAPAAAGTVDVQQQTLAAGPGGIALLDITAQGGPVTWTATATPGITLDVTAGTLGSGQSAQIQVTVDPSLLFAPGAGQVTVNGVTVQVTWG